MSYILKKSGAQVAVSGAWNPVLFSEHCGTSFPDTVQAGWSWEHDDWSISWVDDPVLASTPEQVLSEAKSTRREAVNQIVVTTASGKAFDGGEDAQARMDRHVGILEALNDGTTSLPSGVDTLYRMLAGEYCVLWVLADSSVAYVSASELKEAVVLSGIEQTRLWVAPYNAALATTSAT